MIIDLKMNFESPDRSQLWIIGKSFDHCLSSVCYRSSALLEPDRMRCRLTMSNGVEHAENYSNKSEYSMRLIARISERLTRGMHHALAHAQARRTCQFIDGRHWRLHASTLFWKKWIWIFRRRSTDCVIVILPKYNTQAHHNMSISS